MKFEVFEWHKVPKKTVYFRVVEYCGDPVMAACDAEGKVISYVVGINELGELWVADGISRETGLALNAQGQILVRATK